MRLVCARRPRKVMVRWVSAMHWAVPMMLMGVPEVVPVPVHAVHDHAPAVEDAVLEHQRLLHRALHHQLRHDVAARRAQDDDLAQHRVTMEANVRRLQGHSVGVCRGAHTMSAVKRTIMTIRPSALVFRAPPFSLQPLSWYCTAPLVSSTIANHLILFSCFPRTITVRSATATIRIFSSSWKAAFDMCCRAMKLRLFCAKNTKPGMAYLAEGRGREGMGLHGTQPASGK